MLTLGNKLTLNSQPIYKFVNKYSIDFDGVDDRIITDGANTVLQNTTYSFWCKTSRTGSNVVLGHGDYNIGAFHFNYDNTRPLLYLNNSCFRYWNDVSQQDDGEWHHWVLYLDTDINNTKLYCDGVLQTVNFTATSDSPNAYTESLTIGATKVTGGNSFLGKIDEFAVYDRELTQAEITRMYNTYYSPNRVANGNFAQIGNEEVTNGDFSQIGSEEVTGFTNGTTYPFTTFTTSGNNITSAIVSSAFAGAVSNAISVTSGKIYKVTFDYTKNSGDDLRVVFSSVVSGAGTQISNSELISASGSYTKYFTITSTTTGYLQMGTGNSGHSLNASITNVSVKEVGQDWTFGDGWGMGDGIATCDGSQSSTTLFYQNLGSLSGKNIKLSFTLSNYSAGHLTTAFFGASGTTSHQVSANGDYTFYIYIESGHNGNSGFTASSSFIGSVDNISVKEVGQHWSFGTGWSTDGTKAIYDDSAINSITQTLSLFSSKTYKIQFKISNSSGSGARMKFGNAADSVVFFDYAYYTDGQHTLNYNATSNSTDFNIKAHTDGSSFDIDNIVVQELKHDATNLMLNAGAYQSANPLITSTKSMEFDGSDNYLKVTNAYGDFTGSVSFWVNRDNNTGYQFLYDARGTGGTGEGYAYASIGIDVISVSSGTVYVDGVATTTVPTDGNWHNVVITGITLDVTEDIKFASSNVVTNLLNGKMTEVGLWDRTLTDLEVASLYNQGMPTNLLVNRNNYQSGNPTVFNTKQVDFDGTDDYLTIGNIDYSSYSNISVSAWINSTDTTAPIIQKESVFRLIKTSADTVVFTVATSNNSWYNKTVSNSNLITGWNHIVGLYDGSNLKLYVNGSNVTTNTGISGTILNNTNEVYFGRTTTAYYSGGISQVGIWNEALTADEVSSLYNHGLPIDLTTDQAAYASSSNLVGYWRMGSGTLDTYPLIADQTNATLGSNLVVNGTFETPVDNNEWFNFGSPTTAERSTTRAYAGSYSYHIVGDSTNDGTQAAATQFVGDYTVGDVVKITAYVYPITAYSDEIKTGVAGSSRSITSSYDVVLNEWNKIEYYVTITNTTVNYITFLIAGTAGEFYLDNVSAEIVQGNPAIMTNQTSSDIENGSPYANIVQNGTFDTDSDWTKETGWTISGGTANYSGGSSNRNIRQAIGITNNKTYKIQYQVTAITSGEVACRFGGMSGVNEITATTTGTYVGYITANSSANGELLIEDNDNNFVGSIDNVTVEEVNTGLQGYWKMGDGTNDEYPVIYDQVDPTLGSELVTNGNFATEDDWQFNNTGFSAGAITFDANTDWIFQGISFTVGKTYKIVITKTGVGTPRYRTGYAGTDASTKEIQESGTAYFTATSDTNRMQFYGDANSIDYVLNSVSVVEVQGNPATMTNMVEGNITNQYPLTKIRNYYRMGDGILDGYPIIQDQTSPNLAHIPTTNKILYSEDFSSWTTSGVTITPDYGISPDGTQNSTRLVYSAGSKVIYKYSLHSANTEANSIYVKGVLGETIKFGKGSTVNAGDIFTLNGSWQRLEYVSTTGNQISLSTYTGATARDIQIWGVQIEEQSQATAYLKSDGIAAVRKSSTTNLITYSEDFTNAAWSKNESEVVLSTITSPLDSSYAYKLQTLNNNNQSYTNVSITTVATNRYTFSAYVKKADYNYVALVGLNPVTINYFDLVNGTTFGGSTTSLTYTNISDAGNGWYRCSVTFIADTTTKFAGIYLSENGTSISLGGAADGKGVYIWGAQLEEQTQAETYAPTYGLPVTIDLFTENNYGTMTNMSASDIIEDTPNN